MLVSSTSMNAAIATTTAISQGLNRGRQVTCSSTAGAAEDAGSADRLGGAPVRVVAAINRKPKDASETGLARLDVWERVATLLLHENFRFDGHSEAQRMIFVLARFKNDL